jgi:hypothetical protein
MRRPVVVMMGNDLYLNAKYMAKHHGTSVPEVMRFAMHRLHEEFRQKYGPWTNEELMDYPPKDWLERGK